jgi:hypothetical protein
MTKWMPGDLAKQLRAMGWGKSESLLEIMAKQDVIEINSKPERFFS